MKNVLEILIPVLIAVISSVSTYLITKNNNSTELTINDRQLLSEDEKQFRAELRDSISAYKLELEQARSEIRQLREEVASLHVINLELTVENKQLQLKVDDLRDELKIFKESKE